MTITTSGQADEPSMIDAELVLARHGQGACNADGVIGGERGCTGLSPWGLEQSRRIAERLAIMHAARPFDALFSTPRLRVRQTAEIIGVRLDLPVTVVHELRGQDFGAADGQAWSEVTAAFGGPPMHDPDRPIADGAEPWNVYAARVLAALRGLLAAQPSQRLLLVGHGKTIALACALLQGPAGPVGHVGPDRADGVAGPAGGSAAGLVASAGDHGALTHWQRRTDALGLATWSLVRHNDQAHLIGAPRGAAAASPSAAPVGAAGPSEGS